jgi:predicted PurR-regulated permease PerM
MNILEAKRPDLTRTMLAIIFIVLLGLGSLWVLSPFLPALAWATMFVIATWPVLQRLQAHLYNRRSLAVIVMVGIQLLVLILPFTLAIWSLVEHADDIAGLPRVLEKLALPPPPEWVSSFPRVAEKWRALSSAGTGALAGYLTPHAGQLARWFVSQMGSFGLLLVNLLLVVVISGILYTFGETAATGVRRFARRLAGERGEDCTLLAAQAVRAVALGIVVTALVQSLFGGIGLAIAGVPYAMVLTAIMFVLGVAQIGAGPILLLATAWLFWQDQSGWGVALLVWTIIVGSLDNFLRPLLIKRGADLPLLLIFAGVIGGLITLGIIGLFIGPLVLAVTYTLLKAWVEEAETSQSVG